MSGKENLACVTTQVERFKKENLQAKLLFLLRKSHFFCCQKRKPTFSAAKTLHDYKKLYGIYNYQTFPKKPIVGYFKTNKKLEPALDLFTSKV